MCVSHGWLTGLRTRAIQVHKLQANPYYKPQKSFANLILQNVRGVARMRNGGVKSRGNALTFGRLRIQVLRRAIERLTRKFVAFVEVGLR